MTTREIFNQVYMAANRSDAHSKWLTDAADVCDQDIMVCLDGSGKPVASLMALPYQFAYQDAMLDAAAIKYLSTRPEARARGAASHLIVDTLAAARSRGKPLCVLVPPRGHLFFYFDRFSFATVFYADELRYTASHVFDGICGDIIEPTAQMLASLEKKFGCGIVHSAADFARIRDELSTMPNSRILGATDGVGDAILVATTSDDNVAVHLLLADTEPLAMKVLSELRRLEPHKTFVVDTPPLSGDKNFLRSRGMARIVDPLPMLKAMAAKHKGLHHIIKITDGLLSENTGFYLVADGDCEKYDCCDTRADLEVSIETFTSLVFSKRNVGEIFNLPTCRPYLSII